MDSNIQPHGAARPGRPLPRLMVASLGLAIAASLALGGWFFFRRWETHRALDRSQRGDAAAELHDDPLEWRSEPQFVGSQACRKCHPDQFESFLETIHSHALEEIVPESEPADAMFDDPSTKRRYRTTHRSGRLMHEVSLLLTDGTEVLQTRFPVRYRFGSGHFGKGYLVESNGFLVESPISWFESRHAWGISPGFNGPNLSPFGRTIPEACLLCHSGHFERSTVSDIRVRVIEPSIGCERCHGPGQSHLDQQAAGQTKDAAGLAIVNPRRLTRKLAEAICHQCHLQGDVHVPARGSRAEDFHPGELLEKYRQEYAVRKPRAEMQVVGHVGQLAQSGCYRKSETLTCTTCHDPHAPIAPENRAHHYRTVCLTCHDSEACKLGFPERVDRRQNDCAACHMPSRPTEMLHIAFTHHQIGKHPLQKEPIPADGDDDLLTPLFDTSALSDGDRQRSLGLAWEDHFVGSGAFGEMPARRLLAGRRAEELLTTLPAEVVDWAAEGALARLYYLTGRLTEAEDAARRTLKFSDLPTEPRTGALAILGNACFQQQRFSEAERYLSELSQLRRNSMDWNFLGESEYKLGNVEAAINALETSRILDPDWLQPRLKLARIYHARKDLSAEKQLRDEIDHLTRRGAGTH